MPAAANPFATTKSDDQMEESEYAATESRYVNDSRKAPYSDANPFFAPHLRIGIESTPDAMRMGNIGSRTMRPEPIRPDMEFYGPIAAEGDRRHSVEIIDANGWVEKPSEPQRFAPNPRSMHIANSRITQGLMPRSYSFWRPFNSGQTKGQGPREFNGMHFSMADHRRTYDIFGMQPPQHKRNTYRLPPEPWDTDIVDMPPPMNATPYAMYTDPEMPLRGNSGRLD
jgi:hypothetical protein